MVLSVFAVAAGPVSAAGNTNVELQPSENSASSGTVEYDLVLTNADGGVGAFDAINVTVADTNAATIDSISSDIGAAETSTSGDDQASVNVQFGADTANTGAVTLATITVQAGSSGSTDLNVDVTGDISDESGQLYTIDAVNDATFTVDDGSNGGGNTGDAQRGDSGSWDTSTGEGDVGDNAIVYQGEDDIDFTGVNDVAQLQRTGGSDEGTALEMPIPQDASTGSYEASNGFSTTVATPRVTTLEVLNNGGSDVAGGILTTDQDDAVVNAEYNYQSAEDIELTVEDENGLDVTDEIVVDEQSISGNGQFSIDPNAVDAGEYTFTVAGVDDLDFGSASDSVTVTISSDRSASLNLDSDEVVQGQNLQYTIENSPEGNYHAVTIDSNNFRDGITDDQAGNVFRNVGDTAETGVVADDGTVNPNNADIADVDYTYAVVEIDDGNGVGSIETQYLDDSSIDVDLYPADANQVNADGELTGDVTDNEADDDASFDVTEGEVSLDSPSGAYVVGSEVDVNGTANEGVDEVAIYARNNNEFELVTIDGDRTVEVDSDNSFQEEGVVISQGTGGGNDIISLPGTYRLGVIDSADADIDGDNDVDDALSTSNFNSGVSSTTSISVTDTELDGSFTTINGQIASDDGQVDVEGTAPGKDELVVAFVDSRGNAEAYDVTVDGDGTFDEEDLNIGSLSEGSLSAHIISSGRDGTFGDDTATSASDFADLIVNDYAGGASTGSQVRDRILANSVEDTASDDLIVTENFRLADGLTTIESATDPVALDGTLTVEGMTNRAPEDNTITVELLNEDGDSITIDSTDSWETDGQWSVELDLSEADLETGTYTVESDDGDNTDRVDIEVVEEVEEDTPADTPEDTPEDTPADTPADTPEDTPADTPADTEEPADTTEPSESETPGFGAVVALVALVAAALLAVRRRP
ncbi:HVO_2072 family ArtA-dependent S-layer glycoprotein [Halopenitus sp. POP-27]|uniref:HVO_2072 family ArtA-dependent S-layer glycoprotein n=1 Tax=Halopenitus sp. POP-27 TaxID=2994425 RepID=UPI0024691F25|nr:HVO_2072 family ArtA-dependent S-layer glycoprotein [Halopenitus sp. POP-27]